MKEAKEKEKIPEGLSINRIASFSDAVFAVAITLLVLTINIPNVPKNLAHTQLAGALLDLQPQFLAYVWSFLLVGIYWIVHHNIFTLIKRRNTGLTWLNLIFLMFIVFIPFSTDLISEYPGTQITAIFYALNLGTVGLMMTTLWWYASRNHRLIKKDLSRETISNITRKSMVVPCVAMIVIIVSFINNSVASYCWLLIIVFQSYFGYKGRKLRKEKGYY